MTPKALAEIPGSRYFPRKDTDKFSGSLLKICPCNQEELAIGWIYKRMSFTAPCCNLMQVLL